MAVVGYARVSTVDQNLTAQLEQLTAAGCDRIYQEKVSGVQRDRPELVAMLDYVREGDVVICCKLDRIARSTRHLLEIVEGLEKKGAAFQVLNIHLDTTTPTGKLMLTMLAAVAMFEREMMLERQAEGIKVAKEEGRYKGRKPTAMGKAEQALQLLEQGLTKQAVADKLGIGIASVYRIVKEKRAV
jgi:DNA invertase Pin-like site-specific DNA recombinase